METNAYHYSAVLDEANHMAEQRTRVLWSPSVDITTGFSPVLLNRFNCVVACAVLFQCQNVVQAMKNVKVRFFGSF